VFSAAPCRRQPLWCQSTIALALPDPCCRPNQARPFSAAARPHLGVQEGGAAVAGHHKVAAERVSGPLGGQLLHGEEEGHALAAGQLHGHGGVVDAVVLLQLHVAAAVNLEAAGHLGGGGV